MEKRGIGESWRIGEYHYYKIVSLLCSATLLREHRQTVSGLQGEEVGNREIVHSILFKDSQCWREKTTS